MTEPNLLLLSLVAFLAVFLLLSVLAGVMHGLTLVFPHREVAADSGRSGPASGSGPGAETVAAITAAVARTYPGMKVTRIQEDR